MEQLGLGQGREGRSKSSLGRSCSVAESQLRTGVAAEAAGGLADENGCARAVAVETTSAEAAAGGLPASVNEDDDVLSYHPCVCGSTYCPTGDALQGGVPNPALYTNPAPHWCLMAPCGLGFTLWCQQSFCRELNSASSGFWSQSFNPNIFPPNFALKKK